VVNIPSVSGSVGKTQAMEMGVLLVSARTVEQSVAHATCQVFSPLHAITFDDATE